MATHNEGAWNLFNPGGNAKRRLQRNCRRIRDRPANYLGGGAKEEYGQEMKKWTAL